MFWKRVTFCTWEVITPVFLLCVIITDLKENLQVNIGNMDTGKAYYKFIMEAEKSCK